jgi:hypothetical protein
VKTGNLCWGQRYIWLRHHHMPSQARHEAHIIRSFDLPGGIRLATVRSTLNYLVRRHEALRTTFHIDSDTDPQQRVHPPGPVPLTVVSVERDGTATPAETIDALSTAEFDLSSEWPIRACVITAGGVPKQLVLVLNHVAFDAWTVDRFEREMQVLGAGAASRRPVTLEPVRHQPLDLARYESTADAAAVRDRALAYWRAEIAQLPGDVFGSRRAPGTDQAACSATLTSPSMLDASRHIADRYQVWPSLVHVATYTMLMAAYTGSDEVTHLSFTGNRGSNAYTDVMTCMFSPILMRVDCHDNPPYSQLLKRATHRFEQAQQHADLPYDEFVELLARESFRRGEPLHTGSELNFLNHGSQAARARRTRFAWNSTPATWAEYGSDAYFRIYELRDAVVVALNAVGSVMDGPSVERFLRGYEAVLLAHQDPSADLRIDEVAGLAGFSPPHQPTGKSTADLDRTGRGSEPAPAEQVLAAVVQQVNQLDTVDPSDCYVVAGGRVLRIPRVLAVLRQRGWTGVSVHQLASGQPLRALAGLLTAAEAGKSD